LSKDARQGPPLAQEKALKVNRLRASFDKLRTNRIWVFGVFLYHLCECRSLKRRGYAWRQDCFFV